MSEEKFIRVTFINGYTAIYRASKIPEIKDGAGNPLPLLLAAVDHAEETEQERAVRAELLRV